MQNAIASLPSQQQSAIARTAVTAADSGVNLDQSLPVGVLQERLKVESEGVGALALGLWFQSRDHCESKVNCFLVLLEQYSNRLDCER
jgi:hypothetical protein